MKTKYNNLQNDLICFWTLFKHLLILTLQFSLFIFKPLCSVLQVSNICVGP